MSEKVKIKSAFLLGAGCEANAQLGISSGAEFKKDIVFSKGFKTLYGLLNSEDKFNPNKGSCLSWNSHKIFFQTVSETESGKLHEFKENPIYIDYLKYLTNPKKENEDKKEKFKDYYKTYIYDELNNLAKDNSIVAPENSILKEFLENVSLCSFLDGMFSSLRYPTKYEITVNKLLKIYFSAYKSIIKKFEINYESYKNKTLHEKRKCFANELRFAQQTIMENKKKDSEKNPKKKCYYEIIGELKSTDTAIITTNYTDFSMGLSGLPEDRVSYIHGKLNLFEDIQSKRVCSLEDFENDEVVMPFLFLPSGVKPIVCDWQIQQYEKACRAIREAENLFVLGYGANSDDEHIANFLRERLNSSKKIIWYCHSKDGTEEKKVRKILGESSYIEFRKSKEFTLENLTKQGF